MPDITLAEQQFRGLCRDARRTATRIDTLSLMLSLRREVYRKIEIIESDGVATQAGPTEYHEMEIIQAVEAYSQERFDVRKAIHEELLQE